MKQQKALVIGASGMAGRAMVRELRNRGYRTVGLSRSGPDVFIDATTDELTLIDFIRTVNPCLIVNCAAIVSLDICEKYPNDALRVNSKIPALLAECANNIGSKFIQISTDHFYSGDADYPHAEDHPIQILNQYASSKRLGEINALKNPESLVIRTNIAGFRGNPVKPTFIEWLISCIEQTTPLKLFTDFYTSTIDTQNFSRLVLHQKILSRTGLLNIASSSVLDKKSFAIHLANYLGITLDWSEDSSVQSLNTARAESLGLDCTLAESIVGGSMPDIHEVVRSLVLQRNMYDDTVG